VETFKLLKEEIGQTTKSEHDFAKWKLIVVASLGGAALGLGKEDPHYWLLLFIPFICAYIDLHSYQYQNRIMVIARFLRSYRSAGASQGDEAALQEYENVCERLRRKHFFDLGQYANLASSLILSVIAPGFAVASTWKSAGKASVIFYVELGVWAAGIVLIWAIWHYHRIYLPKKLGNPEPSASKPAGTGA